MKRFSILTLLLLMLVALLIFGSSIYMPIMTKIKGKNTVQTISSKIEVDVFQRLQDRLNEVGLDEFPAEIVLVGLKEEQILELYANTKKGIKLIKEYPFTAYSGQLGPKLQEGDRQIPEGLYEIAYLNPNSSYYLSIKINYPNTFDKAKSRFSNVEKMGNDIFIHGKALSIGCIPIGDKAIEEVFLVASKASITKVIISPRDFRSNPNYPTIESIDWEEELYDMIKKELENLTIETLR